jgi:uncharacterized membrane protein YeaQ/YmgE (transglycosylase-associated protein family)
MEPNPYESPATPPRQRKVRYGLRTLLVWIAKYDVIRVQVTLVLGCVGVMVATWLGLAREDSGGSSSFRAISIILGIISAVAVMEGVWKLDN